ncbi:MAG: CoB--CoM heterodisulfide reductase iron-sulfur subunit B family protein [Deltaproteobacteria bacterium]|nr:CoB--CoM heterodisulfide reductase iron-sulfur subunit B family protein [Deltaproteobacteria bacterium]
MKEATYYPGCSLHGTAREYDESFRGVSKLLEVNLHELEDWTCCGSTSAHCTDEALSVALPVRNLNLAGKYDREMIVPCVACYSRFKAAQQGAKEHPEYLPTPYEEKVAVHYALDFFCDSSMIEALKTKTAKPLSGLKVACYYGCLAVRPPDLTGVKQYENPDHMDRLMEILGAEAVPWSYKTDCCGASLVMTRTDIVITLSQKILSMALEAGADCIVTGCTMCHANLDTRQASLSDASGNKNKIPVFYFTELMGLAMGHREVKKWLSRHVTDPIKLLSSKGLL